MYCGFIDFIGFMNVQNIEFSKYILLKSVFLATLKIVKKLIITGKYCGFMALWSLDVIFCCYLLHLVKGRLIFACIYCIL